MMQRNTYAIQIKNTHRLSAFTDRPGFIKDSISNAVLSKPFPINTLIDRLAKS